MRITICNSKNATILFFFLIGAVFALEDTTEKQTLTSILDSMPDNMPSFMKKMSSFLRMSEQKDETTQQMKKEGYFCSSCKSMFNGLQQYQLSPIRFTISEVMGMMCKYYWKQDPRVCDDAVKTNGKIVLDSLQQRYLDADLICPILRLCPETYESVDISKLIEDIIKDKPKHIDTDKPKKERIAKILHMSDLHFDNKYAVDSNALCSQPTCCRDNSGLPANETSKAGYWGIVAQCDLPFRTIEATVSFIKRNFTEGELDFIIWTGDSTNHFIWEQTQDENINNTLKITELFQKELPSIPVLPVMGNHESYPCNVYDYASDREKNLNSIFASAWEYWIGKEAAEQYKEYGFYSTNQTKLGDKLRIIALNTQAGNPYNWFLLKNPTDPGNQLGWMRQELQKAEQIGEKVYIIGHIPSDETIDDWADIYSALVERYSHIIRGQFYGHTHNDHFKFYLNKNSTQINNVALITSSLTTYGVLNPSFRLIELDRETFQLFNYKQYRLNLTYHNQNKIRDVNLVNFDISYDFNQLYGYDDMSDLKIWEHLSKRILEDLETYQIYQHNFKAGTQSKSQFTQINQSTYCELHSSPRLAANCNNTKYKRNFYEQLIGSWFSPANN